MVSELEMTEQLNRHISEEKREGWYSEHMHTSINNSVATVVADSNQSQTGPVQASRLEGGRGASPPKIENMPVFLRKFLRVFVKFFKTSQ